MLLYEVAVVPPLNGHALEQVAFRTSRHKTAGGVNDFQIGKYSWGVKGPLKEAELDGIRVCEVDRNLSCTRINGKGSVNRVESLPKTGIADVLVANELSQMQMEHGVGKAECVSVDVYMEAAGIDGVV